MGVKCFVLVKRTTCYVWIGTHVTKNRGSEITQHTGCVHDPMHSCLPDLLPHSSDLWSSLNTLTAYWRSHTHIVRPKMSLLYFHITTEQSSQDASPIPSTHIISSQRKYFHSKLYTLLESTSLISIRCSKKHQRSSVVFFFFLSFSLFLSLSLSHTSTAVAWPCTRRNRKFQSYTKLSCN
jgi:hypothetical protein